MLACISGNRMIDPRRSLAIALAILVAATFLPTVLQSASGSEILLSNDKPSNVQDPDKDPYSSTNRVDAVRLDMEPGGSQSSASAMAPMSPGTVTVYGWIYFLEEESPTYRSLRRARVELWDRDLFGDWWLTETYTDESGYFEFPPVDNYDGWLEGTLDVFFRVFTDASAVWVTDDSSPTNLVYYTVSDVDYDVPDGQHSMGYTLIFGENRGAFGIFDTILIGYDYASSLPHSHLRVHAKWPMANTQTELDGVTLDFRQDDEWDEDVILHEYSHSILYFI